MNEKCSNQKKKKEYLPPRRGGGGRGREKKWRKREMEVREGDGEEALKPPNNALRKREARPVGRQHRSPF